VSDRQDDARMQTHTPGDRPAIRETGAATEHGSLPPIGRQAMAPRFHTRLLGASRESRVPGARKERGRPDIAANQRTTVLDPELSAGASRRTATLVRTSVDLLKKGAGRERPVTHISSPDRQKECDAKNDLNSAGTSTPRAWSNRCGPPSELTRGRCDPEPLTARQQTRLVLCAGPLKSDGRPSSLAQAV
jgi:hypothetical protein